VVRKKANEEEKGRPFSAHLEDLKKNREEAPGMRGSLGVIH